MWLNGVDTSASEASFRPENQQPKAEAHYKLKKKKKYKTAHAHECSTADAHECLYIKQSIFPVHMFMNEKSSASAFISDAEQIKSKEMYFNNKNH